MLYGLAALLAAGTAWMVARRIVRGDDWIKMAALGAAAALCLCLSARSNSSRARQLDRIKPSASNPDTPPDPSWRTSIPCLRPESRSDRKMQQYPCRRPFDAGCSANYDCDVAVPMGRAVL